MPSSKLKEFLDSKKVRYEVIRHSPAYTAQGIAASAHVKGKELAKTVMIKVDGEMAMAVLPAPYKVDFELLKRATGSDNVELASEDEFRDRFPGCEVGAMPPFGNLYDMGVYVTESLSEDKEIAFNAGTHTELIRMFYSDFERLVHPTIMRFSARHQNV